MCFTFAPLRPSRPLRSILGGLEPGYDKANHQECLSENLPEYKIMSWGYKIMSWNLKNMGYKNLK
jgi:hypothetical protein